MSRHFRVCGWPSILLRTPCGTSWCTLAFLNIGTWKQCEAISLPIRASLPGFVFWVWNATFEESYTFHTIKLKVEVARYWSVVPIQNVLVVVVLRALAMTNCSGLTQGGERLGKISRKVVGLEVFREKCKCMSECRCMCVCTFLWPVAEELVPRTRGLHHF